MLAGETLKGQNKSKESKLKTKINKSEHKRQ